MEKNTITKKYWYIIEKETEKYSDEELRRRILNWCKENELK